MPFMIYNRWKGKNRAGETCISASSFFLDIPKSIIQVNNTGLTHPELTEKHPSVILIKMDIAMEVPRGEKDFGL